ncbi:6-phosphogluconolactonase [Drechslerella dactyloides]|uniref:6-phosphogluconolactonase n=1 Tax=Drechslerella dactyloides TaxID=74499 RepID=A0AAD6IY82_DREDA|nr:6-phosphogluconolactonase [Drechslerella dactyloides]
MATIHSFPSKEAIAPALFSLILDCQKVAIERHGRFQVAVSGGSLPAVLALALLEEEAVTQILWEKWEIFFADERAVPLDHEDSNYGLLKAELLDKLPEGTPQPNVVPIDTEYLDDVQELADQYNTALINHFAKRDSILKPAFDLLLLGCGPDGHTCSLFPNHELLREHDAWVAAIEDSPKPPPKRITLTLPVIAHASKVAFVATGAGKQEILKKIFESPEDGLPCSLVNTALGEKVMWFVDHPAVEGVSYPRRSSL